MQVQWQEPNPYKISISKITKEPFSTFNSRPIPSLPSHISWEEQAQQTPILTPSNQNSKPKRRRKIFEHQEEKSLSKPKPVQSNLTPEKQTKQQKMMRKVKSNTSFVTPSFCQEIELQQRIKEVNRQLASHRQSRTQLSMASTERKEEREENKDHLSKLEQKLAESTFLMKKQEEVLNSKIPSFQRKIEANNNAISQVSSMIQTKFQENSLQVSRMIDMVSKNESRLRSKEDQLQKINSELIHKEYELMRNKEQKKRRELELIRMKRIEDLQNKNLELYQSIEKQNFKGFQDLQENQHAMVEREVWEDELEANSSRFSYNQESTIKYQDPHLSTSRSGYNNTLGQILSPLALSQYQY